MSISQDIAKAALDQCASEPVHTPGTIQPVGALIAFDRTSNAITHVSENVGDYLGTGMETNALLGTDINEVLGTETAHYLADSLARLRGPNKRQFVASRDFAGQTLDLHACLSGDTSAVIEIEPDDPDQFRAQDVLQDVNQLLESLRSTGAEVDLLQQSVDLLRLVTGYDRVMAYRFDATYNGSVIAESRVSALEPMLGLHFPSWDIPPQARAIMSCAPLRFISDCNQVPVPILAASAELPALDITVANTRGVSPVHMEYLRNMGTRATMTLSLIVDDKLWGLISFHHRRPRVPSNRVRQVCTTFLPMLQTKLALIMRDKVLHLSQMLDSLREQTLAKTMDDLSVAETLAQVAPDVLEPLQGSGLSLMIAGKMYGVGRQLDVDSLRQLTAIALKTGDATFATDALQPELRNPGDPTIAGICISAIDAEHSFCVLRGELAQSITWAGSPDKAIDVSGAAPRLSPRQSFKAYIQDIAGKSAPWTQDDLHITRSLGATLLAALEKREDSHSFARQQSLMIRELDHRVKNILNLIQSISREARRDSDSVEDYSKALDTRITALAAAHDVGLGDDLDAVSLHKLLKIEAAPFVRAGETLSITGPDCNLHGEFAPIVALVLHELMTNAAKHGALSTREGRIEVALKREAGGIAMLWQESGSEGLVAPNDIGFGMSLVRNAIPYELGGRAELDFLESGIEARFWLPSTVVDLDMNSDSPSPVRSGNKPVPPVTKTSITSILVVEDNFMIASDLSLSLRQLGVAHVDTVSNVTDALEFLDVQTPDAALLDINLGPHRQPSTAIADRLHAADVPFVIITGYSDLSELRTRFAATPILRKPITEYHLGDALAWIAARREGK